MKRKEKSYGPAGTLLVTLLYIWCTLVIIRYASVYGPTHFCVELQYTTQTVYGCKHLDVFCCVSCSCFELTVISWLWPRISSCCWISWSRLSRPLLTFISSRTFSPGCGSPSHFQLTSEPWPWYTTDMTVLTGNSQLITHVDVVEFLGPSLRDIEIRIKTISRFINNNLWEWFHFFQRCHHVSVSFSSFTE